MTLKGHVENGTIILDEPLPIADGSQVTVQVQLVSSGASTKGQKRLEHYKNVIGALKDKPEDWAERHDDYLRDSIGT